MPHAVQPSLKSLSRTIQEASSLPSISYRLPLNKRANNQKSNSGHWRRLISSFLLLHVILSQIPNHIRGECPVQEIDRKFVPPPLGWVSGPLSQPTKENRQLEDMAPVVKRSPAKRGKMLLFCCCFIVLWCGSHISPSSVSTLLFVWGRQVTPFPSSFSSVAIKRDLQRNGYSRSQHASPLCYAGFNQATCRLLLLFIMSHTISFVLE